MDKITDAVLQEMGGHRVRAFYGPGGFAREPIAPSGQVDIDASSDEIGGILDGIGYLAQQTGVIATKPQADGDSSFIDIVVPDGPNPFLKPTFASEFWTGLLNSTSHVTGFQPTRVAMQINDSTRTRSGIRIINLGDFWTPEQLQEIYNSVKIVSDAVGAPALRIRDGILKVHNSENDWRVEPDGRSYLRRLVRSERPGLQGTFQGVLAPQVGRWIREAFKAHAPKAWEDFQQERGSQTGQAGVTETEPQQESSPTTDAIPNESLLQQNRRQVQGQGVAPGTSHRPSVAPIPPQQKRQMGLVLGRVRQERENEPTTLRSPFDIVAPGRQGVILGTDKPRAWVRALAPLVRSLKRKGYERAIEELHSRDNAPLYTRFGLYLASRPDEEESRRSRLRDRSHAALSGKRLPRRTPDEEARLYGPEAHFTRNIFARLSAYKVPALSEYAQGMGSSGRAAAAFLDQIRADAFDAYLQELTEAGYDPDDAEDATEFEAVARWVNLATGRGNAVAQGVKSTLKALAFSPGYGANRVQALYPADWSERTPRERNRALRSYLTFHGSVVTTLALASLLAWGAPQLGISVVTNPEAGNFATVRLGNWTHDLAAGTGPYIGAVSELLAHPEAERNISTVTPPLPPRPRSGTLLHREPSTSLPAGRSRTMPVANSAVERVRERMRR